MSEKKEPPSDDRDVFAVCVDGAVRIAAFVGGKWKQEVGPYEWEPICSDVVDWCEIAEWPDLVAAPGAAARLADAQARLDKAQARMLELEAENAQLSEKAQDAMAWRIRVAVALDCVRDNGEIGDADYVERHAMALRRFAAECDAATARAERAEKERDEARGQRDRIVDAHRRTEQERATLNECNDANILELSRADRLVGDLRKERDQAIRERDEARAKAAGLAEAVDLCADRLNAELAARPLVEVCPHCGPGTDLNTALNELADTRCELMGARERAERAESQRDEVGCQLEALRAVQRDDLQVLVARIALVEADVAGLKGDRAEEDTDADL